MTLAFLPWTTGWMVVPFIEIWNTGEREHSGGWDHIFNFQPLECELPVRNPSGDDLKAEGFIDLELRVKNHT